MAEHKTRGQKAEAIDQMFTDIVMDHIEFETYEFHLYKGLLDDTEALEKKLWARGHKLACKWCIGERDQKDFLNQVAKVIPKKKPIDDNVEKDYYKLSKMLMELPDVEDICAELAETKMRLAESKANEAKYKTAMFLFEPKKETLQSVTDMLKDMARLMRDERDYKNALGFHEDHFDKLVQQRLGWKLTDE